MSSSDGSRRNSAGFNGVKVFSATMFAERDRLGDRVSDWLANNPQLKLVDLVITQSSDAAFHCLAITAFYYERR